MKLSTILTLVITTFVSGCSSSHFMLERGQASYERQDFRQAFLRLEPVAKAGNMDAQYALAYMYYNGQGVVENSKQAEIWMQRAADQGHMDAIKALSMIKTSSSKS